MYHYHNNQTAASTGATVATVLLQQFYEKQNHQIEILFSSENRNKKLQKLAEWHKCFLRQKHQCSSKMPLERSKIIDLKALKAV